MSNQIKDKPAQYVTVEWAETRETDLIHVVNCQSIAFVKVDEDKFEADRHVCGINDQTVLKILWEIMHTAISFKRIKRIFVLPSNRFKTVTSS